MQAYPTIPRSNDNKEGLTVAWRRRREVERLVLGIAISVEQDVGDVQRSLLVRTMRATTINDFAWL